MNRPSALATLYYALALAGLLLTWYFNGQYLLNGGGLGPEAFLGSAFANALTTAITLDVYIPALVFAVWVFSDSARQAMKWPWLYVVLCFGAGLAVALPLYLANREQALGRAPCHA